MFRPLSRRACPIAVSLLALAASSPAHAADTDPQNATGDDILVIAQRQQQTIENAPSTRASTDAKRIAETVNAVNVEDTIKYLPSLVVRKRHIGDTQAPLATRTSGLGASARSLVYADGALLSSLIGNNNTSASPRWSLVAPEEIARIDVLYGPYSAAYAGNSIGAVVNITTRLPDKLEGTLTALANVQTFSQYGTKEVLPTRQIAATLGDRFGPLALFASATRTVSNGQPISYVTATRTGVGPAGSYDDLNRTGGRISVLGAGGLEHQRQDMLKFKAALDVSPALRLTYVGGLFRDDTEGHAESYLSPPTLGSAFLSGIYTRDARHWSHSLSANGSSGRFDWQVIGTLYDFAKDEQRSPSVATSGPGQIVRLDDTGWKTLDAKGAWRGGDHTISAGGHWDAYRVNSNRYATTDWIAGPLGARNQSSQGRTETAALWAQDAWRLTQNLTLTIGGRYEWWRAYDGFNFSLSPALSVRQPERKAQGFSSKASLEWRPGEHWSARLSFGKAYRFPTVGELYQAITTGTVLTVPDPSLRPERALSEELAITRSDGNGSIRVSLFNESVADALISQAAPLVAGSPTLYNYVQNVDRTRVRGAELALDRRDIVPRVDLAASVTYADSQTRQDAAFPAAVGKLLPSVPRWKATTVLTWRPTDIVSLTAAARYASRNYGALDNSDVIGNTYQGFYKYLVVDVRARFQVSEHASFAVGIDNLTNDKYFLFHPFPQRSFTAELGLKL